MDIAYLWTKGLIHVFFYFIIISVCWFFSFKIYVVATKNSNTVEPGDDKPSTSLWCSNSNKY